MLYPLLSLVSLVKLHLWQSLPKKVQHSWCLSLVFRFPKSSSADFVQLETSLCGILKKISEASQLLSLFSFSPSFPPSLSGKILEFLHQNGLWLCSSVHESGWFRVNRSSLLFLRQFAEVCARLETLLLLSSTKEKHDWTDGRNKYISLFPSFYEQDTSW